MPEPVFTVYKTKNLINGKIYIGVHKTKNPNDSYLGSGKLIGAAVKKYGKENFQKEVLFIFSSAVEAYAQEASLVNAAFVDQLDTYNLRVGGTYTDSDKYGQFGKSNSQYRMLWVWHPVLGSKKQACGPLEPGWTFGRSPEIGRRLSKANRGKRCGPLPPDILTKVREAWASRSSRGLPRAYEGKVSIHKANEVRMVDPQDLKEWVQRGWIRGSGIKPAISKLTLEIAREIRGLHERERLRHWQLARLFGVSRVNITLILNGKIWVES